MQSAASPFWKGESASDGILSFFFPFESEFHLFDLLSPIGSSINVEGSLKTEKWEDRDGNKKQITKVIGSKLIMLGERKKKDGREPGDEGDTPF